VTKKNAFIRFKYTKTPPTADCTAYKMWKPNKCLFRSSWNCSGIAVGWCK